MLYNETSIQNGILKRGRSTAMETCLRFTQVILNDSFILVFFIKDIYTSTNLYVYMKVLEGYIIIWIAVTCETRVNSQSEGR